MCLKSFHCNLTRTFMFPPGYSQNDPIITFHTFGLNTHLGARGTSFQLRTVFSAKTHGPLKPRNWHLPDRCDSSEINVKTCFFKHFLNLKTLKVHVMSERIHWQTALWECHWSASSWYSLMFAFVVDLHWPESFAFLSSWPPHLLISADAQSLPAASSPPPLASSSPPPAAAFVPVPPSPERETDTKRETEKQKEKGIELIVKDETDWRKNTFAKAHSERLQGTYEKIISQENINMCITLGELVKSLSFMSVSLCECEKNIHCCRNKGSWHAILKFIREITFHRQLKFNGTHTTLHQSGFFLLSLLQHLLHFLKPQPSQAATTETQIHSVTTIWKLTTGGCGIEHKCSRTTQLLCFHSESAGKILNCQKCSFESISSCCNSFFQEQTADPCTSP